LYEDLRNSGGLKLPSGQLLSDYKNFDSPNSGWTSVHPLKLATITCEQLCPGRKMPIKICLNQHDLITEVHKF
jgi:hypothetical protein